MSERIAMQIPPGLSLDASSLRREEIKGILVSVKLSTPLTLTTLGSDFIAVSACGLHTKRWKFENSSASLSYLLASTVTRRVIPPSLAPPFEKSVYNEHRFVAGD